MEGSWSQVPEGSSGPGRLPQRLDQLSNLSLQPPASPRIASPVLSSCCSSKCWCGCCSFLDSSLLVVRLYTTAAEFRGQGLTSGTAVISVGSLPSHSARVAESLRLFLTHGGWLPLMAAVVSSFVRKNLPDLSDLKSSCWLERSFGVWRVLLPDLKRPQPVRKFFLVRRVLWDQLIVNRLHLTPSSSKRIFDM